MKQEIYAHRGASGYAPENTLEAFAMAAEMRADGVELDVHICRSGELVVTHDELVDRCSDGSGRVADMTLAELKKLHFNRTHPEFAEARIPTLEEVFRLLKPAGLKINIELKNSVIDYPDLEAKTLEAIAKAGMEDRILFSSFNHFSMMRVKQLAPDMPCGLLYEATMLKPWAYAVALGMDALHPAYPAVLLPGGQCTAAHRAGIRINAWTVNREADIRAVLAEGADGVITNYPDLARRILEEK